MYKSNTTNNLQNYSNLVDSRILQRFPNLPPQNSHNKQLSNTSINHQINLQRPNPQSRNSTDQNASIDFSTELAAPTPKSIEFHSNRMNNISNSFSLNNSTVGRDIGESVDFVPRSSTAVKPSAQISFAKPLNLNQTKSVNKSSSGSNVRNVNESVRIFTGTVEKVLKWHKINKDYFCYYETLGAIVSIQEGSIRLQKIMLLRDKKGPILQLVHYPHDYINIENFFVGQMLRVVGRMVGPNIMHGISIREAKPDEITALQRMCYISDHAISKSAKP